MRRGLFIQTDILLFHFSRTKTCSVVSARTNVVQVPVNISQILLIFLLSG